jgi:hypothetical protein
MRLQGVLPLLAAVLVVLFVSACGSSSSNPTSDGAPVNSSTMRSTLEQQIVGTAGIKANGEASSHEDQITQFSTACAEKIASAGG